MEAQKDKRVLLLGLFKLPASTEGIQLQVE
jgi:hypothetical protein